MQNSVFKAGFTLAWGGTLTNLTSNRLDIVNRFDAGREVQTAFYDRNQRYIDCPNCAWGWNPTEGGDKYKHGSVVVEKTLSSNSFYVKTLANEWNPDGKGGGSTTPVPSDVYIEKWVSFVPNFPNVIKMHYKITHSGADDHSRIAQGFPGVFLNNTFNTLVTYSGLSPWTSDAVSTRTLVTTSTPFAIADSTGNLYASESWQSLVNSAGNGLTVFVPGQQLYVSATSYGGSTGPTGQSTMFMRPNAPYAFSSQGVLEGDIYLVVGTSANARNTIYSLKDSLTWPSHLFDLIGRVDRPAVNSVASGTTLISGWAFDSLAPVTGMKVYVNGNFEGDANYGLSRGDVVAAFPNAPANSGFNYNLDTTKYLDGFATVSLIATYADGAQSTLHDLPITILNLIQSSSSPGL